MTRVALAAAAVLGLIQFAGPSQAADVRMYVRHDVADYAAWRKVYDGFDAERTGLGVTAQAVYRSLDNPNDVTVSHDFKTSEAAKAFASSPNLKNAMQNAGVKGQPQVWFVIPTDK
jgi:hypothetical protein